MDIDQLKFPVVAFNKGTYMFFAREKNDLTSCNRLGLRNGFYNGLIIIDTNGNKVKVKSAQKIGTGGGLFGYNVFLEQRLKVQLEFAPGMEKIGVEELKKMILSVLKQDEAFWDSDGRLNSKREFISKVSSVEGLVKEMTDHFYFGK